MALGTGAIVFIAAIALLLRPKKKKKKGNGNGNGNGTLPVKKKKYVPAVPTEDCGLFPWLPDEVEEETWVLILLGWRDMEKISMEVARKVYAESPAGNVQPWPPDRGDAAAFCILDRIRIRVNLILADVADQEADDGEPDFEPRPVVPPEEEEEEEDGWGPYPEPGPIDLDTITHPENYPDPGTFHQVGGPNSGTTTKHIAQMALMQAHYKLFADGEAAAAFSDDPVNWMAYRELMDCSPFNDAYLGSRYTPGAGYWYDTPTGRQIAMMPVHDSLLSGMNYGEVLKRRVHIDNPQQPPGGQQPAIWLPPLNDEALAEGRVELDPEYWSTGDSKILPPPEVLVLVDPVESNIPQNQLWGCLGYELEMGAVEEGA